MKHYINLSATMESSEDFDKLLNILDEIKLYDSTMSFGSLEKGSTFKTVCKHGINNLTERLAE